MKKHLTAIALLATLFSLSGIATAETESAPAKKTVKKAPAKKAAAAVAAPASKMPFSSEAEDDDNEPELGGTLSADYHCELGHKLTIWKNEADDKHIAIRWNKKVNRLTRVETTTGAHRFENRKVGLVWIGIPAKGLLLDSKKGQQLANECKNIEQQRAAADIAPAIAAAAPKN